MTNSLEYLAKLTDILTGKVNPTLEMVTEDLSKVQAQIKAAQIKLSLLNVVTETETIALLKTADDNLIIAKAKIHTLTEQLKQSVSEVALLKANAAVAVAEIVQLKTEAVDAVKEIVQLKSEVSTKTTEE